MPTAISHCSGFEISPVQKAAEYTGLPSPIMFAEEWDSSKTSPGTISTTHSGKLI